MGIIASSIKEKLEQSFTPSQLEVIDESHKHAHHRGAQEHEAEGGSACLLYTSPSPRDKRQSRMPSSA